jgi:hypothetical protein
MKTARSRYRIPMLGLALLLATFALCTFTQDACAQRRAVYRYGRWVEKAGPFMMNFRGGPAFGVANADDSLRFLGAVGVDLGFAVSRDYNAYIVLTPNLQFRDSYFNVSIPIGFQYDIRIARGLYLYPRATIGYSAMIFTSSFDYGPFRYYSSSTVHGGILTPEFGIKYVVNGRLNLGFEPFSLPIFFNGDGYNIWYRFMFHIGFNA